MAKRKTGEVNSPVSAKHFIIIVFRALRNRKVDYFAGSFSIG